MQLNEVCDFLRAHDRYLILTHRRPDGDTIGSACALCQILRELGKTAFMLKNPELTRRYLPYVEGYEAAEDYRFDTVVAVDTASVGLLPDNAERFVGHIDMVIDHHPSNGGVSQRAYVRPERAACGEAIYELGVSLLGKTSKKTAESCYLAISTDTGCFQYSNTDSNTFAVAAELLKLGVDAYTTNKVMFGTKSLARLRLEALLTESMEMYNDGQTALMVLSCAVMARAGADEDDADNISGLPRVVEGVVTGVMLREQDDGLWKVSVRTGGKLNANQVCMRLGGGGHAGAAGATLGSDLEQAKRQVLAAIDEVRG